MKYIYIIDKDDKIKDELIREMKMDNIGITIKKYCPERICMALKNIPNILIINEEALIDKDIFEICNIIRKDENNSITPIIVISKNENINYQIELLSNEIEICLKSPVNIKILYYNIKNILRIQNSNRMVSPLTGLPGNLRIQDEIKRRLINQEKFAMLYIDLDNFKAYNDTYGFENGDEIIKFTAKVISKYILKNKEKDNFLGHIGGDDFVAIIEDDDFEKICQNIIAEYDSDVINFFNEEDLKKGYIEIENRKGIIEQFPLTSISIGVVEVTADRFKNDLEIGEAGATVKHLAKTIYGSTYVIDRRKK